MFVGMQDLIETQQTQQEDRMKVMGDYRQILDVASAVKLKQPKKINAETQTDLKLSDSGKH